MVDRTSAVVGEPILLTVHAYIDVTGNNVEIDDADVHDPDVADFAKRSLMKDDETTSRGYASIGGKTWAVLMGCAGGPCSRCAPGTLTIGPMSMALARPRSAAGTRRASETIHLSISEPPLAGRPPGYSIGDVGHFTLNAQVQPRQTEQGAAIGVHVDVSGRGNVPNAIAVPSRPGVEWLTPQVHEQLGPIGKDTYGGTRSFDYVVRLTRAGDVDLGDLALPFWDPDARRYVVASAKLGTVNVAPTPAAQTMTPDAPAQDARARTLQGRQRPGLTAPRTALEGTPVAPQAPRRFGGPLARRSRGGSRLLRAGDGPLGDGEAALREVGPEAQLAGARPQGPHLRRQRGVRGDGRPRRRCSDRPRARGRDDRL